MTMDSSGGPMDAPSSSSPKPGGGAGDTKAPQANAVGMAARAREAQRAIHSHIEDDAPPSRRERRPTSTSRRPRDSYTRFVRLAKLLLPGVAIIVMAIALLWPNLQRTRKSVEASVKSTIADTKVGNFAMLAPKYFGIDKSGRPFKIEAKSARQHGPNSPKLTLTQPKGSMTLASGNWVAMSAKTGEYDQKTQVLILIGDVNVYHDAKYTFKTSKATVDVKTNDAWGDQPVVVNGPKANIEAEGFRVKDKGKTVLFTGKSKVILHVDNEDLKGMTAGDPKADGKSAPPPAKGDKK